MGVKVEGVRSDERVAVVDTTARNRRMLIGGAAIVAVVVVLAVVIVSAIKPTPTYGPVGHQFRISFGGSPTQAGNTQLGGFTASSGVTGQQSWRYGNSSITETVLIENFPKNDPYLIYASEATNLLVQELAGSHAVTLAGLPGVEVTASNAGGLSSAFPYTDTAVLLQQDTQFVISASGTSQSDVSNFVHSFKTVS